MPAEQQEANGLPAKGRLLQPVMGLPARYTICRHCSFVNELHFYFCTQCGYPLLSADGPQILQTIRLRQRKTLLESLQAPIQTARVLLYLLSGFCATGIVLLLSQLSHRYLLVMVSSMLALFFIVLAQWSRYKPFPALLTGLLPAFLLSLLFFWGSMRQVLGTIQSMYSFFISFLVLYILIKGIRAAYKANLIKAETDIT